MRSRQKAARAALASRNDRLLKLLECGRSYKEIAAELRLKPSYVAALVRRIRPRPPPSPAALARADAARRERAAKETRDGIVALSKHRRCDPSAITPEVIAAYTSLDLANLPEMSSHALFGLRCLLHEGGLDFADYPSKRKDGAAR